MHTHNHVEYCLRNSSGKVHLPPHTARIGRILYWQKSLSKHANGFNLSYVFDVFSLHFGNLPLPLFIPLCIGDADRDVGPERLQGDTDARLPCYGGGSRSFDNSGLRINGSIFRGERSDISFRKLRCISGSLDTQRLGVNASGFKGSCRARRFAFAYTFPDLWICIYGLVVLVRFNLSRQFDYISSALSKPATAIFSPAAFLTSSGASTGGTMNSPIRGSGASET